MPRLRSLVIVLLAATLLAGCTGVPSPFATPDPEAAIAAMKAVPGVVDVATLDVDAVVTVGVAASDDEVLGAATALDDIATDTLWEGTITLTRENPDAYDPDLDVTNPAPWSIVVFPAEGEEVLANLAGILGFEKIDGYVSSAIIDGWPHVTLGSIDTFMQDFRAVVALPLFADGGTVRLASDEHLGIVWVPERTTLHAIDEIVAIARDYPDAEVLLQATTEGPQWPTLYIARVSTEDAAAIATRLLDPALADADVEGYGLPFILTAITSEGPVYTDGNLGGVVE